MNLKEREYTGAETPGAAVLTLLLSARHSPREVALPAAVKTGVSSAARR